MNKDNYLINEEYKKIINRLYDINMERDLLENMSNTNNYLAHIKLPNSFGELLINIIRDNKKIDNNINDIVNAILSHYDTKTTSYKEIKKI